MIAFKKYIYLRLQFEMGELAGITFYWGYHNDEITINTKTPNFLQNFVIYLFKYFLTGKIEFP